MTDKATVEVPSPVSGRVVSLGGKAGDKLAVGAELIRLETDGAGAVAEGKPAAAAAASAPAKPVVARPKPAAGSPTAETFAPTSVDKPLASPSVRRHARELQIELSRVRGSGPGGRIEHDDLVRHAQGAAAKPERALRYAERSGQHDVAVIGLRRQIALRMRESLKIPHFTYVEEIDVTELEALRAQLNDEHGKARGRLTVLPFLMRAIVLAMPSFPMMNARFDDEKGIVTRYGAVHLGVAAQTEAGLMVPVVRHAETLDLWSSAAK